MVQSVSYHGIRSVDGTGSSINSIDSFVSFRHGCVMFACLVVVAVLTVFPSSAWSFCVSLGVPESRVFEAFFAADCCPAKVS